MTIELPDESLSRDLTADQLRLELGCALFARGRIGKIAAARLAGVDFFTFQHALKDRKIPQYTDEMLEQDLRAAREFASK